MNHIEYHEKALEIYIALEEGTTRVVDALQAIKTLNAEAEKAGIPVTHTPTENELRLFIDSVTNVADTNILAENQEDGFYQEDDNFYESSYEEEYDGSW